MLYEVITLPIIKIAELKKGVDNQTDFTLKQLSYNFV